MSETATDDHLVASLEAMPFALTRAAAERLRALAQERDAAKAKADRRTREVELTYAVQKRLTAERDAARAEVERYRIALMDLLSWQSAWPQMARQLAQEGQHMQDAVKAARAALAAKEAGQ